uniref:Transmembrane protein 120 homolog n=2 Tax=Leersia perrieri TaxID=77586 RepID=A0A0D9X4H1_9ORYZ
MAEGGEAAAARVAEQARELQDAAAGLLSRAWAEEEALRRRAAALQAELSRLRKSAAHADCEKVEEDLDRATCLISDGDIASLLPSKTHGTFLKMFLGPINLRAPRKEVQLKVKEEYNSYRDRTALLFLGFPVILLFLRSWLWNGCFPALPVQLYQRGVELFLCWAIMQGFAMMLQNRYQRQRLYTRIALGKARRMDVVWGETAGVEGQLLLLCPVLFLLQGFEGYVGFLLLRTAHTGIVPEWQVVVCGALLIAMAIGNFANTVDTLMAKSRFKAKKKSKGKRDSDTCNSPTGLSPTNSTARA